jgi:hypothetical protein
MTTISLSRTCTLIAAFAMLACSGQTTGSSSTPQNTESSSDDGGTASGASIATTTDASGSGSSSGGATSPDAAGHNSPSPSPSEGGLLTTDGAAQNDPDVDYSVAPVTLTMTSFQVEAGDEVYYCQNFANPWGMGVDIKIYSLVMGPGSHHMFAFYQNGGSAALEPCPNGGLQTGPFTFVSQSAKKTVEFPQSVGATIPTGTGFQLMVHYLNATASTITASVALTMYVAKPGVVTQHAGVLFLDNTTMTVAPTCTGVGCQSSESYTLPQDIYVLSTEGHMHKYATDFVTTVSPTSEAPPNGQIYQTSTWDEPAPTNFSPPLHLTSGTTWTWTCTDVNNTGEYLTFGESAVTNVMCISQSIIYPISDVNDRVLTNGGGGL